MAALRRLPSGRWQASVRLPNGRRITYTSALKGEAKSWAVEQETRIRTGTWRDPRRGRITFDEWWTRWTAARIVEPHTAAGDRASERRIKARFGGEHLRAIGRVEVQGWVRQMREQSVGPAAIGRAFQLLRACMSAALDEGIIDASPCRRITLPPTDPRPPRWFTHEQADAILDALVEPYRSMVALMCWSGLRWGEAAGLRICDVDWPRNRLTVIGVTLSSTGAWKEYPKNSASRGEVPAPEWVIKDMSRLVGGRERTDLVFRTPSRHRSMTGSNWNKMWHAALKVAKVPYLSPHTCRHTCASWLVQAGVPLYDVARQLRHASIVHTQIYAHLAPDAQARVVDAWKLMAHQRRTKDVESGGKGG